MQTLAQVGGKCPCKVFHRRTLERVFRLPANAISFLQPILSKQDGLKNVNFGPVIRALSTVSLFAWKKYNTVTCDTIYRATHVEKYGHGRQINLYRPLQFTPARLCLLTGTSVRIILPPPVTTFCLKLISVLASPSEISKYFNLTWLRTILFPKISFHVIKV